MVGCVSTAEFRALEHEVAKLKRAQASSAPGSDPRARLAELGAELTGLREEVNQLHGELEQALHLAQRALEQVETRRRAAPAAGGLPPVLGESATVATPGATTPPRPGAPPIPSSQEVRDYEAAFRLYRGGDYTAAIARFERFLDSYPSSDHADNAMFWMGACHHKLEDYELAAVTFDRLVRQYPEGNKVPDALYRQGVALLAIGEQKGEQAAYEAAAAQIFERITAQYSRSDRVDEARRQLEKLKP